MTKGDKILVFLLIVASIASFWFIREANKNISNRYISIQVDGKEIKTIPFNEDTIGTTEVIQTEYGRNVIAIGDQTVRAIEADCPDKLDVLQGEIRRPGQLIVCLPNRLVIEIRGTGTNDGPIIDDTVR